VQEGIKSGFTAWKSSALITEPQLLCKSFTINISLFNSTDDKQVQQSSYLVYRKDNYLHNDYVYTRCQTYEWHSEVWSLITQSKICGGKNAILCYGFLLVFYRTFLLYLFLTGGLFSLVASTDLWKIRHYAATEFLTLENTKPRYINTQMSVIYRYLLYINFALHLSTSLQCSDTGWVTARASSL